MRSSLPRRLVGALVLVLSGLPVFRILIRDDSVEAPFREVSVQVANANLDYALWGTITTLLLGLTALILLKPHALRERLEEVGNTLARIPVRPLAASLAAISTVLALLTHQLLYRGFFTNVDEIGSALHARYLAEGALAGPLPGLPEAWLIPNMLMVDAGWVSQYPAGHLLILAAALKIGLLWLAGPLLLGVCVGFTTLALPRLLPEHPALARVAAILTAFSPYMIFIGAGSMSHTSAGAAGAVALWAGLRARDGSGFWALLAGAAVGLMVSSRPWVGLVLGSVATLGLWLPALRDHTPGWFIRRAEWTLAGGVPFALVLGWFNTRLFGSAGTLGYLVAFGERHELGFHPDPWGSPYGLAEAVGFTSTDLLSFGTQLLETPLPLGVLVGLWLVLTPGLSRGVRLLVAWALLPVAANFVYWFHDPRMLYEAAPAWIALGVLAVGELARTEWLKDRRFAPRDWILTSALIAVGIALTVGIPNRTRSYLWSAETVARVTVPEIPGENDALVFVHASWNERLSSQLQGAGQMRQDSVITVIRRNSNCALQRYAEAREARVREGTAVPLPEIALEQVPGTPPDIERPPAAEGATLRVRRGEAFPPTCRRQLRADRFGAVALAPLLWQGDLPGIEEGRPIFVRDLGPEKNARMREFFPDRTPWVYVPKSDGGPPELVTYEEGMRVLWGEAPGS